MKSFSERVLAWFEVHGRKHLPWQQGVNAYKTWVSEIMLQQTQVATVIPYFNRFVERFPNVVALADAEQDDVLAHWAGLGYYSRARNLHKAAQIICDEYQGIFPNDIEGAIALPGVGKSTAGAILSLAYQQRHAILDGNVKRVLSRHQMIEGIPNQASTLKKQWAVAEAFTPAQDSHKYTQAMMDLGAIICTRSKPQCEACPVQVDCGAYHNDCITNYPNKKPKKVLPEKHVTMLIITDGERIHLEKRPDKGIWGGLWSLPEVVDKNHISACLQQYGATGSTTKKQPVYTHTFTHYRLHITPLIVHIAKLEEGFSAAVYDTLALPTPIRRILARIEDN